MYIKYFAQQKKSHEYEVLPMVVVYGVHVSTLDAFFFFFSTLGKIVEKMKRKKKHKRRVQGHGELYSVHLYSSTPYGWEWIAGRSRSLE